MAEIHIERKKRSPWGWIIALVVLLLVAYALYKVFADQAPATTEDQAEPVGMKAGPEPMLFERFLT